MGIISNNGGRIKMKEKYKSKKGITLIALIVTIVILLNFSGDYNRKHSTEKMDY